MAAVVLNALAKTELSQHLKIKAGALLDALRLDELALRDKPLGSFNKLGLDRFNGAQHDLAGCDVVGRWVDHKAIEPLLEAPRERVKELE